MFRNMAISNFKASDLVSELERLWTTIREHHPDLPRAVMAVASGTEGARREKRGEWAEFRWKVEGGEHLGEVFVAAEGLQDGPEAILSTLLHEAAHAIGSVRGTRTSSRQGRYHNRQFKMLAREVGLLCEHESGRGWAATALTPDTSKLYADALEALGRICAQGHRQPRAREQARTVSSRVTLACACAPARRIRAVAKVARSGPILCGVCSSLFAPT